MVAFYVAFIKYQYEPEGFDLPEVGKYLPDFYLPQVDMYAEVKADTFNIEELKKAQALATHTGKGVLLLTGIPSRKAYYALTPIENIKDVNIMDIWKIHENEITWVNEMKWM